MKNDPDPESSAIERANAAKVDTITRLQKAQFLAQADSMHLDETTQTPVKKKPDIGDKQEIAKAFQGGKGGNISFQKFPTGVYGHNDLQKGLYILLRSMGIGAASAGSECVFCLFVCLCLNVCAASAAGGGSRRVTRAR